MCIIYLYYVSLYISCVTFFLYDVQFFELVPANDEEAALVGSIMG